ncbi:dispanin subfamily A member 2b-like [Discoglossus pictus]
MEYGNQPLTSMSEPPPQYKDQGYHPHAEELKEFRGPPSCQVQSTVITMTPNEPSVRDHLVWSIFNLFYMNFCCLGLIALVFSVKSRDRKLVGDKSGARSYGTTSYSLNIAATVLSIISLIIFFVMVGAWLVTFVQQLKEQQMRQHEMMNNKGFPFNMGNYGK